MDFREAAAAVAALADELRAKIYGFVRAQRRPVSREEVATQMGISRGLAAFHLDKLMKTGWLTASYARPTGRGGRGAGRTSKYYEPSPRQVELSIPARRYDIVAEILISAMQDEAEGDPPQDAVRRAAAQRGEQLGVERRRESGLPSVGGERALDLFQEILTEYGFEPYQKEKRELALSNCPFHALAKDAADTVCPLNRSFIQGIVRGLGDETVETVVVDRDQGCCVNLRFRQAMST
ncbi:MAG: transcriptional regulator [Actinomycetota bacterium]|nr:transcriptional regulator [Actinomycetota bacterium]